MPGETDLHKRLKKEACRWLYRMGYRCIAAEVRIPPVGIVDAAGTGLFGPYANFCGASRDVHQTVFIECKASRADFLRDDTRDGQMSLFLEERRRDLREQTAGRRRNRTRRYARQRRFASLGKFQTCLACPTANLHYVLAPAGLLKKKDLPPRWGLLTLGEQGVSVTVRPQWQELADGGRVEAAIARTLTGDIYRADDRAMGSVNREIMNQQQALAERIRALTPMMLEQTAELVMRNGQVGQVQAGAGQAAHGDRHTAARQLLAAARPPERTDTRVAR